MATCLQMGNVTTFGKRSKKLASAHIHWTLGACMVLAMAWCQLYSVCHKTRFLFFLGVNGLCFASLTMCNSTCTCSCRSITQTAQVSRRTAHWTLKFCESASSAGVGLCQAKVWSSTPLSLTTKTQFFQSELPVTSVFCMG